MSNLNKGSIKQERPVYDYEDTPNDNESDSPSSTNDAKDGDHKGKKKYSVIPQAIREKFINRVLSKEVTIKEAAKEFGLKFSTSKAILQTYKKEGRIGKKKNRERKTKVVNVVFVCNINPVNPYASNVFPIISVNEIKGSKGTMNADENKNKLVEQTLQNYPEHKVVHQTHLQIPNDSNKSTQQFIKELGNEFLKGYIEKNFNPTKISSANPLGNSMNNLPLPNSGNPGSNLGNPNNYGNASSMGSVVNMGAYNNMPPPHLNTSLNGPSFLMSQQLGMGVDLGQLGNLGNLNPASPNPMNSNISINQKRSFQTYEKDTIPELDLKEDQINEPGMRARNFRSGDEMWGDYDMDRSKKDLEDFIYKTHNAIKNNTYIGKTVSFDFTKYKDDFN